jgi:hypothetical protein
MAERLRAIRERQGLSQSEVAPHGYRSVTGLPLDISEMAREPPRAGGTTGLDWFLFEEIISAGFRHPV